MENALIHLTASLLVSSLHSLSVILFDERQCVFIVSSLRYEISYRRVVSVDVWFLVINALVRSSTVLDLLFGTGTAIGRSKLFGILIE
jgi:hypothetical protein